MSSKTHDCRFKAAGRLRVTVEEGQPQRIGDKIITIHSKRKGSRRQTKRFVVTMAAMAVPDDAKLGAADAIVVSAVDRLGNESPRIEAWRKPVVA